MATSDPGGTAKGRVVRLAGSQLNLVSVEDAESMGFSRNAVYRLARAGEWSIVLPKIVAVGPTVSWRQRALAACVWAGSAATSHSTAGFLWQLDGIRPGSIEISVAARKKAPRKWLTIHEVSLLSAAHRRDGIPVTSASRTLIDLAGAVAPQTLELALEDALRRGLTSVDRLRRALREEGGRGKAGCLKLAGLLSDREGIRPTESPLEIRLLQLLRRAGLPAPVRQHLITHADGFRARVDFAYPKAKVAIEVDGYRWHPGRRAWQSDRRRMNKLAALEWRVLYVTAKDLATGAPEVIALLRSFVGQQTL